MKKLFTLTLAIAFGLCAQVPNVPNDTHANVRTAINNATTYLDAKQIKGTGAPSATCSAGTNLGTIYVRTDAGAPSSSFYVCDKNGVGVYAWELLTGPPALTMPALFAVAGSGTASIGVTLNTQIAGTFWRSSGSTPFFGSLLGSDISGAGGMLGVNSLSDIGSAPTARTNLGLPASVTIDTTNATNISSGTLNHLRLPALISGDIPSNAASTSGNAATATNFDHTPTLCPGGQAPTGGTAHGDATGCQAFSGSSFFADQYPGADASVKINACLAAVVATGGGTCDARKLNSSSPQTLSQTISVGSTSLSEPQGHVVLLLPDNAVWNWAFTNGTSCGILQYNNTAIIGTEVGGGYAGTVLGVANSSTNMDSLYCTAATNGSNVLAEGFAATNNNHGTFTNGLFHIQDPTYDESHFERINGYNNTGDVWHIDNACCGTTFNNIQGASGGGAFTTGGYPLVIKGGNSFSITNSSFHGPGTGKNNIYINGSGGHVPNAVNFYNVYMERFADYTTPAVYIGASSSNTMFYGGTLITNGCTAPACVQVAVENHSAFGFSLDNFQLGYGGTTHCVNDIANSLTWPSDGLVCNGYKVGNGTSAYSYNQGLATWVARPIILTAQAADVAATTIYTTAPVDSYYRICMEQTITRAATTSSTLPYLSAVYTSAIDSAGKSVYMGDSGGAPTNATWQSNAGCVTVYAKASTAIQWQTANYASVGATSMQFSLTATVERQ